MSYYEKLYTIGVIVAANAAALTVIFVAWWMT